MCCRMNCFSPERCELAVKPHKRRIHVISSWVFLDSGLFQSADFNWNVACMMQQTYRKQFLLEGDFNTIWAASWQNQQSGYAPNEDLDQPGWSESSLGAQPHCWFCHEVAHFGKITFSAKLPPSFYNRLFPQKYVFTLFLKKKKIAQLPIHLKLLQTSNTWNQKVSTLLLQPGEMQIKYDGLFCSSICD